MKMLCFYLQVCRILSLNNGFFMLKHLLISLPLFLNAGFFDWFDQSSKATEARELLHDVDSLVEKALKDYQAPGLAIGVVVDGQVVYAKGFGFRDVEKQLPVSTETLFAIGSCTKAFTTFAMGTLVDEGVLEWDQPVIDILPQFRLWDQYATANLTMRDLLTHRSGLPRHELMWYNSKMSKLEMLKRIRYLQPSYDIRERYQYGNLTYFVAGLAIETASGTTWEDLVRERILDPLEMNHTNFSVEETQKGDDYASPYLEKGDLLTKIPFRNISLIGAAGALNSNIHDMMHWVQMQLAGGVYRNRSMIAASTLKEMHAPQVIVPGAIEAKEAHLLSYGIGWTVASYRGHHCVSHDGVSDGFTSVVSLLPNDGVGVVVLCNKNMTTLSRYLSFEVIDRILGVSDHNWLQDGIDSIRRNKEGLKERALREDQTRKKGTFPSHALEEYVGIYEHPGYGTMAVELRDNSLVAIYNDLEFVLGHWHYDIFSIVEEKQAMIVSLEGSKLSFINNADGNIYELNVPFEQAAGDIIFKKKADNRLSNSDYLRRFTGSYDAYGYTVDIVLRNHALVALIPGQPNYELVPSGENEFTVKGLMGTLVRFVRGETAVEEIVLVHPYGAFSAIPKNRPSAG
jgi:CubicO group peptidase (beta-lactamase class C family)